MGAWFSYGLGTENESLPSFITILHLMGIDHERQTHPHLGRDFRLTDVYGRVVPEILA